MLVDANIKPGLFELPADPLGDTVLIPAFKHASSVRGAFGWFSAGWISRLAAGLATFIDREDTEPIDFVISPRLYQSDFDALEEGSKSKVVLFERVAAAFEAAKNSEEALARHAADCLAWLVYSERLRLRIAKPVPGGNYHPKIWLFDDGVDQVAVRGSANATERALGGGVEHMDVDCSWVDSARVKKTAQMLDAWGNGISPIIDKVYELDEALKAQIIQLSPDTAPSSDDYASAIEADESGSRRNLKRSSFQIPSELVWRTGLYSHQGKAVEEWEENGRRGILEMATGSGKTITALICAYRAFKAAGNLLVIISVPSNPLVEQWKQEVRFFSANAVTPTRETGKAKKKAAISNALLRLQNRGCSDRVEILVVTNHLMSNEAFQNAVRDAQSRAGDLRVLHIGDEAHTLGTPSFLKNTPEFIDFRLGLSATPERQYDQDGTAQLQEYFGETVFQFGLGEAIGFCLVPYDYHVHVGHLNEDELAEFSSLSKEIARKLAPMEGRIDFSDDTLTTLLIKRRAVIESADDKIRVLKEILKSRSRRYGHLLIYSSSKDPEQHECAKKVVADLGYISRQVTQSETSQPGLVPRILQSFEDGDFEVLLAKKVLDEGVDVPSTREAILLSSSTVKREWIQRRGRVLRTSPGKDFAEVHDVIALPPPPTNDQHPDNVVGLIDRELDRVRSFGEHARNWHEVSETLEQLHEKYIGQHGNQR